MDGCSCFSSGSLRRNRSFLAKTRSEAKSAKLAEAFDCPVARWGSVVEGIVRSLVFSSVGTGVKEKSLRLALDLAANLGYYFGPSAPVV